MRLFLILLWFTLPCIGNAAVLQPLNNGQNPDAVYHPALEKSRVKTGFPSKIAGKILQKRMHKVIKSLGSKTVNGKRMIAFGLVFGLISALLLILAIQVEMAVVMLLLMAFVSSLVGLVLCQKGLDHANASEHAKLWVELLAYTGLGINLLLTIASGGILGFYILSQ
jgi:hypothetical protein